VVLKSNAVSLELQPQLLISSKSSTAGHTDSEAIRTFEITHPFHPLRGQQFVLVTRRQNWGEDRVNYFDQKGKLCSILASWTSIANTDYFLEASNGRSWLRVDDLPDLSMLLEMLLKIKNGSLINVK
jgi:Family of unknown function (DUF5372)